MGRGNFGGFHPSEKHCDCLLRSPAISVLHFGPQSASVLISLKAIAGHNSPSIEMHIHSNSRGSTPGAWRLHSAVNQWQPAPFAKLLWPLVIQLFSLTGRHLYLSCVCMLYILLHLSVCLFGQIILTLSPFFAHELSAEDQKLERLDSFTLAVWLSDSADAYDWLATCGAVLICFDWIDA